MTNEELYAKLRTLPREELESYETAAKNSKNFIGFMAVTSILIMIMFTNIVTLLVGGISVYAMSHMSVNVTNTLNHIRNLLSRMPREDTPEPPEDK